MAAVLIAAVRLMWPLISCLEGTQEAARFVAPFMEQVAVINGCLWVHEKGANGEHRLRTARVTMV